MTTTAVALPHPTGEEWKLPSRGMVGIVSLVVAESRMRSELSLLWYSPVAKTMLRPSGDQFGSPCTPRSCGKKKLLAAAPGGDDPGMRSLRRRSHKHDLGAVGRPAKRRRF